MSRAVSSRPCSSRALVAAAVLTVVVGVAADVVAGSHPGHVVAVGVIALALGAARLWQAGRHRLMFGLLSSAVVAQPVLHAADALSSASLLSAPHEFGGESAESLWYVLVAAVVVAGVGAAEALFDSVGSGVRTMRWLLRRLFALVPVDAEPSVVDPRTVESRPRRWTWCRFDLRRGPPSCLTV